MRVLLSQTPFSTEPVQTLDDAYPIGIGYLHAVLESAGCRVVTLPLQGLREKDALALLIETIRVRKIEIIGLQMLTGNRSSTLKAANALAFTFPKLHIVLGGAHATVFARQIVERYPRFIVLRGEAEDSIVALVEALGATGGRAKLDNVAGLTCHVSDRIVEVPAGPLPEVCDIPHPAHAPFLEHAGRMAAVLTTRGCPFACSFCAVARRRMRSRDISDVADEVERLAEQHSDLKIVRFFDDQMFFDVKRSIALADELIRRNTGLTFTAMARVKPCSVELAQALEAAGFSEVSFGLESGATEVTRLMGKAIKPEDVYRCIDCFAETRVHTFLFLISGLPGETEETIRFTGEMIQDLQRRKYMLQSGVTGIATVYPDTGLEREMRAADLIDDDFWFRTTHTPYYTVERSVDELLALHMLLTDHVDATRIFVSERALQLQHAHLDRLAAFVATAWDMPEGPRINRETLRPFVGLLAHSYIRRWPECVGRVDLKDILAFFVAAAQDEDTARTVRVSLADTIASSRKSRGSRPSVDGVYTEVQYT